MDYIGIKIKGPSKFYPLVLGFFFAIFCFKIAT